MQMYRLCDIYAMSMQFILLDIKYKYKEPNYLANTYNKI